MGDAPATAADQQQVNSTPTASTHTAGITERVKLSFYNKSECRVDVLWLDYQGNPKKYSTLQPSGSCAQNSFSTHPWRLEYEDGHRVTYMGGSALIVLLPKGQYEVQPYQANPDEHDISWRDPAWGEYKQRGCVLDMPIMAYDCVCAEAVQLLSQLVTRMLEGCQPSILERIVAAGCNIAIIGKDQVTTDIPPHHFMKSRSKCEGARDIDATTRGLGATHAIPTTSCGEENLTMVDDRRYACENILIHELSHAVMNLGFDKQQMQRVRDCYKRAKQQGLYDSGCYMMSNAEEYWAEGCQSWFDATVRTDVNSGVNTRDKLKAHDPNFAALLTEVLGDGSWRYPHTAPAPLGHRPCSKKRRVQAPQQSAQQQQLPEQQNRQEKQKQTPQQEEQQHVKPSSFQPAVGTNLSAAAAAAAQAAAATAQTHPSAKEGVLKAAAGSSGAEQQQGCQPDPSKQPALSAEIETELLGSSKHTAQTLKRCMSD